MRYLIDTNILIRLANQPNAISKDIRKSIYLFLFVLFCGQFVAGQQTVSIDPTTTYQTIEGFGASDCWTVDFVGQYFSNVQKEQAAQWLFDSQLKSDGSVNGIGLSMWRFNLGGGTLGQGSLSHITTKVRRGDAFLLPDGTYDFDNHHIGQKWFLQKAYNYGCRDFVAFSNSPVVNFTKNGKGFCDYGSDGTTNLRQDAVVDFADYLTKSLVYFQDSLGIPFHYISPVNEPQWAWQCDANGNATQEGSAWTNSDIKTLCIALDSTLQAHGLSSKIFIGEAGQWNYLYANQSATNNKGTQIFDFLNIASKNNIKNLKTLEPCITSHSYWCDQDSSSLSSTRKSAKQTADSYNIKLHQTEWCMLTGLPADAPFSAGFNASTVNMDIALFMARVIHSDLTIANVCSWSYWTSMDTESGASDRYLLLTLIPTIGGGEDNLVYGGTVATAKTLWTLGNYSLFIRPGYQRCDLKGASSLTGLMGSAYISPDKSKLVVVYVNLNSTTQQIIPQLTNIPEYQYSTIDIYQTNQSLNLQKISSVEYTPGAIMSVYGRSVMTFVYNLSSGTPIENLKQTAFNCYPNPVTDYLTCNASNLIQQITVMDLTGCVVQNIPLNDSSNSYLLSMKSMPAGIYLVSVNCRNDCKVFRIIKK